MITVEMVEKAAQKVLDVEHDDEVAHQREDELYHIVLRAIANGDDNAQGLATAALKTREGNFARYTS